MLQAFLLAVLTHGRRVNNRDGVSQHKLTSRCIYFLDTEAENGLSKEVFYSI